MSFIGLYEQRVDDLQSEREVERERSREEEECFRCMCRVGFSEAKMGFSQVLHFLSLVQGLHRASEQEETELSVKPAFL